MNQISSIFKITVALLALGSIYKAIPGEGNKLYEIAVVNSILAACAFILVKPTPNDHKPRWFHWLPALGTLGFVLAAMALSGLMGNRIPGTYAYQPLAVIIWIPLIEEVLFRRGFGTYIRSRIPGWLGLYVSALFFSIAHTLPAPQAIWENGLLVPVGPFVLGLICEWLYSRQQKLGPAIACHAAANASAVLFSLWDQRWLDWLQVFYI